MKSIKSISGFFLVALGAFKLWDDHVAAGSSYFAAGIAMIILFHFHVSKLNVFGLAAELREKINEADMLLEKLKGISLPVSAIAVKAASEAGRYDFTIPRKELYDYVQDISDELRKMNLSYLEIERIRESWYLVTARDMAVPVYKKIDLTISGCHNFIVEKLDGWAAGRLILSDEERTKLEQDLKVVQADRDEYIKLSNVLIKDFREYPDFLIGMISQLKGVHEVKREQLMEEVRENISDIEFLISERKIRRPSHWFGN